MSTPKALDASRSYDVASLHLLNAPALLFRSPTYSMFPLQWDFAVLEDGKRLWPRRPRARYAIWCLHIYQLANMWTEHVCSSDRTLKNCKFSLCFLSPSTTPSLQGIIPIWACHWGTEQWAMMPCVVTEFQVGWVFPKLMNSKSRVNI